MLKLAGMIAVIAAGFPSTAHAYLDPGTGSILLQVLSVGVLSAIAFWHRGKCYLANLFSGKKAKKSEDAGE